jgi:hypothetical protein
MLQSLERFTISGIAGIIVLIQGLTLFKDLRQGEINGLLKKGVFQVVNIANIPQGARIFNSRFVDEIKHLGTDKAFEKSRLVIQAYNNRGKDLVLTQSPTIQQAKGMSLYLRDISQAYVQSNTYLSRDIFIRPLYGVPEAGNHWFNTYHQHHVKELQMDQSTYDPCLLYISINGFGIIGLQTDDTLFLANPEFATAKETKLKFLAKEREQLSTQHSIKFNRGQISLRDNGLVKLTQERQCYNLRLVTTIADIAAFIQGLTPFLNSRHNEINRPPEKDVFADIENAKLHKAKFLAREHKTLGSQHSIKFLRGQISLIDNRVEFTQERQCQNLKLVTTKNISLTNSRGETRQRVVPKDQYIAQRARGAYIATVCQPEAAFDLSFAAQVTNPEEENIKLLNKRIQGQIDNSTRGLTFVPLDLKSLSLLIFIDASFANNKDLSSQIGFVIVLADGNNNANIIHWSSIKCKRVTRSVLASELYRLAHGFDIGSAIRTTIQNILQLKQLPLVLCTDSKSLYECLVKLGTIQEKRLMIDLMCLRQAYERREITEIKWINGESNPADAMTKSKPCPALKNLIDTNKIDLQVMEWVERE